MVEKKGSLLVFIITLTAFVTVDTYQMHIADDTQKKNPAYTPISWLVAGDEPHYLSITSEIIQRHDVFMDVYFTHPDPVLKWPQIPYNDSSSWHAFPRDDGHWISGHGPGLSFMLIPGYAMGGIFGAFITVSILSSLTSVFIYKFTSKLSTPKIGFLTTMIFSFSTILFIWSNQIYSEVETTLFLIIALYVIFEKNQNSFYMAGTGALLGYGIFLKVFFIMIDVVLIPLVFVMLLKHKISLRNFILFLGFFILLTALAVINNIFMYHSIFGGGDTTSVLDRLSSTKSHESIFYYTNDSMWRFPLLIEIFFGKYHGLFILSPVIMLFVLGIKPLLDKNRLLLTTIIVVSSIDIGGYAWVNPTGPLISGDPPFRYFLPIVPLMALPFTLGLQKFSKNWSYRILALFFSSVGFAFAFGLYFVGTRPTVTGVQPFKGMLVHTIYMGFDYFFPNLGPLKENVPLNFHNEIFLIVITIMLSIGIMIPFFQKNKIEQKTRID